MSITIIIPAYNVEKYIDHCINSLLRQTCQDFAVILVDDGSTDGTFAKCKQWEEKDKRITAVSKKHETQGPARNRGISMAKTEYITFLDADDWFDESFLEEMMQGTQGGVNDVVFCDMLFVEERNGVQQSRASVLRFTPGEIEVQKEKHILSKGRTFMCGKVFRRSLFTDYQVEQPAHTFEDISVIPYVVSKAKKGYYVPRAMYCYLRNRVDSTINDFSHLEYSLLSLRELMERFIQDGSIALFYEQLRYLYWGQVCHIFKVTEGKFSEENTEQIKRIRNGILTDFESYFPEGAVLKEKRYFTVGNVILKDTVKHIVLWEKQMVEDIAGADCVVGTKAHDIMDKNIQFISLTVPEEITEANRESISWNLADCLFDAVLA